MKITTYELRDIDLPLINILSTIFVFLILFFYLSVDLKHSIFIIFYIIAGLILEELLHLLFIVLFAKPESLRFRITNFYFLILSFSWIVPSEISINKKMIIVILPPLIIVLFALSFLIYNSLILKEFSAFLLKKTICFSFLSLISLIPIKSNIFMTDAKQLLVLKSLKKNL